MNERRRLFFLALLLACGVLSSNVSRAEYGWPLPDNYGVSATFGESRLDHFHAGIDLSTNGQIGMPVLSIADGRITRLKIQKRGYGRSVYVQHPDGMVSLYAHLDRYSSDLGLEQLYQKKVLQTGARYPGDIFLDPPVPVHKGDVIAYSGETGAGLPHLHLELRKADGTVAINPLLNGLKDIQDQTPPVFQALYLHPNNSRSAINGDLETQEIRLTRNEDGSYGTMDMPVMRGEFSVSVSAYDQTLRPYHRAPQRFSYAIDGTELYSINLTEVSYVQPSNFGLVFEQGKPGTAYYEWPVRLSVPKGIPMPFAIRANAVSTAGLAAGKHRLEVSASDANGNQSIARIAFVVNDPPAVRIDEVQRNEGTWTVVVTASDPDGTSSITTNFECSLDDGKTFQKIEPARTESIAPDALRFTFSLAEPGAKQRILVRARSFDGFEFSPFSVNGFDTMAAKMPAGQIRVTAFNDALKVTYETASIQTKPVTLEYGIGSTVVMNQIDLNRFETILPAPKSTGILVLKAGGSQASVPVHFLKSGVAAEVTGQGYSLSFDADSLYEDTFVWTTAFPAYQARLLPLASPMVQVGPRGLPMKSKATLTFHYPKTTAHPEKLSIYVWDRPGQAWASLPSTVNSKAGTVQTKITFFDLYALLYDNVPPTISSMTPGEKSSISNPIPVFSAVIRDRGMQIDDEKITFYVDGVSYAADFDPDRDLATLSNIPAPTPGAHTFSVTVVDYGGNKTSSPKITFYVR